MGYWGMVSAFIFAGLLIRFPIVMLCIIGGLIVLFLLDGLWVTIQDWRRGY